MRIARSEDDIILKARVSGKSVAWIAREHGCSEEAIEAVLDRHVDVLMTDKALRQALMLELKRLDDYVETFHPKAQEGDPVCGALCVKISERRATLLGLNAPLGHAVQIIHRTEPARALTSTQKIRAAMDNVMHVTVRERQLLDKESEPGGFGITAEEATEIDELRKVRGKGPRAVDPSG